MKKHNEQKSSLPWSKFFPIFIIIGTIFMEIGYASVNSVLLDIGGDVIAQGQTGIFITEVNYVEDNNADLEVIKAYQTMLNTKVILSKILTLL